MKQPTLAIGGFEAFAKSTRRSEFLATMNRVLPWAELLAVIEPYYAKVPSGAGRRPIGGERMLRIYFLQQWFALSDPMVEESLYDSRSMREFVGIDLGCEGAPDETTILKFRHLLEQHDLGKRIFETMNQYLRRSGMKIATGTIVDATTIHAPASTKNENKQRDPEMHQTKKGGQWYFGMKAHIGVDSQSRVIHSVVATAANVHDSQVLPQLLHGNEQRVYGDSAYVGQHGAICQKAPKAKDFTQSRAFRNRALSDVDIARNKTKSKVRARVEHAFLVIKKIFGWDKVRYKGLAKNAHQLNVLCALANLYHYRHRLSKQHPSSA